MFVILLFVIVTLFSTLEIKKIEKDGVWTIQTLTHQGKSSKSGVGWNGFYVFQGNMYEGGQVFSWGEIRRIEPKGMRYFIRVLPYDPEQYKDYDYLVPAWFTLDAPDEGWKEKPTEEELWEMMIQDGIKRGLK